MRSCHAAAWHFHYMLPLLGDRTVMLDDAAGTGLDALRDAGREDVLLASSVEPYARTTIEAARYAAAEGVPVVALTATRSWPSLPRRRWARRPARCRRRAVIPNACGKSATGMVCC